MRTDLVTFTERPGIEADVAFVFHSWLKGSRTSWAEMRSEDYFALQHQRIERLLADSQLVVLHPEGTPAVIAAWALLDGNAVAHYVHVKGEYRGKGCATRLLTGRTIATHMTEAGERLKRKLGLRYMPHFLDGLGGIGHGMEAHRANRFRDGRGGPDADARVCRVLRLEANDVGRVR